MAKVKPLGDRVLVKPVEETSRSRAASSFPTQPKKNPSGAKLWLLAMANPTIRVTGFRCRSHPAIQYFTASIRAQKSVWTMKTI